MHPLQACKFVNVTPPAAIVDNAAFVTAAVDTLGWRECTFILQLGALDIAVAAFKLTESDASNMAGATDVAGADFSVAPLTLPADTVDNALFAVFVNCLGRKRYLDLSVTGGDGSAGSYASILAILSRPETGPDSAADRGLSQFASV